MLAKYACHAENSKGKLHPETLSSGRNIFQHDRDRIIHSRAFRRLEYKTQVFVNYENDHFRTRLTHSLEVAQLARTIASQLGLNQDLTEVFALAHDIGHPPFGHAGENALNQVMQKYGGFNHNAQVIKILTNLESRYADFDGLNLSWEAIEGIVKHNGPIKNKRATHQIIIDYDKKHNLELKKYPCLEAQIASLADDIAYSNHDIDDGFRAGLVTISDFDEIPIIRDAFKAVMKKYGELQETKLIYEALRITYSKMVADLVENTLANLRKYKINHESDIRNAGKNIASFSGPMQNEINNLKQLLFRKIYTHEKVRIMLFKASNIIQDIFHFYMENNECLRDDLRVAVKLNKKQRAIVICDYISGMTDRFAIKHHQELFDLYNSNSSF